MVNNGLHYWLIKSFLMVSIGDEWLIIMNGKVPSGKLTSHNYGKSRFLMGKSTISKCPFSIANCWHNQRVSKKNGMMFLENHPSCLDGRINSGDLGSPGLYSPVTRWDDPPSSIKSASQTGIWWDIHQIFSWDEHKSIRIWREQKGFLWLLIDSHLPATEIYVWMNEF